MENKSISLNDLNIGVGLAITGMNVQNQLWPHLDDFENDIYTGKIPDLNSLISNDLDDVELPIRMVLTSSSFSPASFSLVYLPISTETRSIEQPAIEDLPNCRGHHTVNTLGEALERAGEWLSDDPDCPVILYTNGLAISLEMLETLERAGQPYLAGIHPDQSSLDTAGYVDIPGSIHLEPDELANSLFTNPLPQGCALAISASPRVQSHPGIHLYRLARAVLCLRHRFYPSWPVDTPVRLPFLRPDSPFFIPSSSLPWFSTSSKVRKAALVCGEDSGSLTIITIQEKLFTGTHTNSVLNHQPLRLFLIPLPDITSLDSSLSSLEAGLRNTTDLHSLSIEQFKRFSETQSSGYSLALIASTPQELIIEISSARTGISRAIERNVEWQTPNGSYFTAFPLGPDAPVAFVYPGAFNSFVNLGKDLFHIFPEWMDFADQISGEFGEILGERYLYPRATSLLSPGDLEAYEKRLNQNPVTMLSSGTALAVLYTHLLEQVFDLRASAAFGYSLGEISMLYATRVWQDGDEGFRRLAASQLFKTRLTGPKAAVAEYWGATGQGIGIAWVNKILMCTEERAREATQGFDRVYLTHINTPGQVVIAGDPEQCDQVVKSLHLPSITAPFDQVLHCEPVISEYDVLTELHTFPVKDIPEVKLYSAATYEPVDLNSRFLAQAMARMLCSYLDFPSLIDRVYADGVRVFIETGAGSNCARWIDESIKGKPHLSVSISRKGNDDFSPILRMLARLAVHHIPVNLDRLYQ